MKHKIILFSLSLFAAVATTAQVDGFGLRTNLLPWAVGSPSLGIDMSWNRHYLLAIDGNYGDWKIGQGHERFRHSSAGIELRRYFSDGMANWANPNGGACKGMYLGIDGRYHWINNTLTDTGKEGNLVTAGLVVGYSFHLSGRWGIDAGIGAGYVHKDYNKYMWYPPAGMDRKTAEVNKGGFGLTHFNVALVYRFNK